MSERTLRFLKRFVNVALVSAAAFALTVFGFGTASAGLDACAGDPVLYLSNGTTLRITATIETNVSNVSSIDYTVHLPKGVTVVRTVKAGNPAVSRLENVAVKNDSKAGYKSETLVTLNKTQNQVRVSVQIRSGNLSNTVIGKSGKTITAALP
jgi:hypothetical protein